MVLSDNSYVGLVTKEIRLDLIYLAGGIIQNVVQKHYAEKLHRQIRKKPILKKIFSKLGKEFKKK